MNSETPEPHTTDSASVPDEVLARDAQEGNAESFGILVGRFEPKLKRYGTKFLRESMDIEDMVQEIFMQAYRALKSYDPSQRFSPWIYRIAHNTFVNALRKKSRLPFFTIDLDSLVSHPHAAETPERESEEREMKAMVEKGLAEISESYQEVLILYYQEELSYKEIADVLRVPVGTVGVRMRRAKAALAKVYTHMDISYEF
ncbi:MAG: polymerase subunit sigma-24 [Parcubacteria group bacterium]|nr:polymerase subunit sigma-24 [Parcubacteria group bacterium]